MTALQRWVTAAVMSVLLAGSGSGVAETFDRGQALYENHCMSCHEATVHTREAHRATSLADLRRWVATWSFVITSYSIHYTKLYEVTAAAVPVAHGAHHRRP